MSEKLGMQIEINFEAYDIVNAKLDKLLKRLQKANKLDIEVDTHTFEKLEKQFNKLKDKIDKSLEVGVNTTEVKKAFTELNNEANKLEKKQIKLIDGKEVQIINQVRKSLLETEKVVKNLETGSRSNLVTFDYKKAQTDLYGQLDSLQKNEFSLKEKMIGQDDVIKNQLQEQLNLVKQQQIEVGKLISSYKLQDEDSINKYLVERQKLTSDLTISQEKYNKKMGEEADEIQTKIRQYQSKMATEVQNLQTRYKDIVPSKQLNEFQAALSRLNSTSLKGLQSEIKDLDNQFKKLTADTKMNGVNVSNHDSMGMSSLLSKDLIAFASWKIIGDAVMLAYRSIGDSVKFVYDMDTALVSLKKITQETSETYRQFAIDSNDVAKNLARGTTEVVDATVAWKKAGYSLNEAKQLSTTTLIGANVGDVDVKSIQEYLVAPLKAWNIQAQDSIGILNVMNNVSNQHAITIQDLGQSYARASSVMAMANNSLEETTALVTAAQAQTQLGGDTIGNGLTY